MISSWKIQFGIIQPWIDLHTNKFNIFSQMLRFCVFFNRRVQHFSLFCFLFEAHLEENQTNLFYSANWCRIKSLLQLWLMLVNVTPSPTFESEVLTLYHGVFVWHWRNSVSVESAGARKVWLFCSLRLSMLQSKGYRSLQFSQMCVYRYLPSAPPSLLS